MHTSLANKASNIDALLVTYDHFLKPRGKRKSFPTISNAVCILGGCWITQRLMNHTKIDESHNGWWFTQRLMNHIRIDESRKDWWIIQRLMNYTTVDERPQLMWENKIQTNPGIRFRRSAQVWVSAILNGGTKEQGSKWCNTPTLVAGKVGCLWDFNLLFLFSIAIRTCRTVTTAFWK